jgi:Tfp pilus assembly protein FimV
MKKEFSKFFVASLKRTAQNVSPLVRKKQKLQAEIAEKEAELESIQVQLDAYEAPIKEATGGFTTEDLVVRVVEVTDKLDKDGKPIKATKWNLKYPETIVPVVEELPTEDCGMADPGVVTAEGPGSDFDEDNAPIDII